MQPEMQPIFPKDPGIRLLMILTNNNTNQVNDMCTARGERRLGGWSNCGGGRVIIGEAGWQLP